MAYEIGDPNHIQVHNALVSEVQTAASRAGVEVILPDVAGLGDLGHTDDHNLIVAALQAIADAGGGMTWAKVSGGTVTTVSNPDGSVDEIHTFNASGTLEVTEPGYANVLLVSSGCPLVVNTSAGGGADIVSGLHSLPAGALPVVVGAAKASQPQGSSLLTALANPSSVGTLTTSASGERAGSGATPANADLAYTSSISGASDTYGLRGDYGGAPRANRGDGGGNTGGGGASTAGIVIVRVQQTPPTVTGVVATGGAVNTYTGDGTNGVLGQKYKTHTFTANGTFTVTQGGAVDVLVVAGGQAAKTQPFAYNGGSGSYVRVRTVVGIGAVTVAVGAGDTDGGSPHVSGGYSRFASILAAGGNQGFQAGVANGGTAAAGVPDSITGVEIAYARATVGSDTPGSGGVVGNANGKTGVVVVRYEVE